MTPLKSLILVGIALFSAIASVQAQLTINNPIAGTVWTAGKPATITWVGTSNLTAVDLILRKGDANNLATIATIASKVDPSAMSYTYDVPSTLVNGDDYTVGIGVDPNYNYCHYFAITGGTGSSNTTSTNTTSSTTSSSSTSSTPTSTSTSASKSSSTPQSTSLVTVTTNRPTPTPQNSVPTPASSSSSIEVNVVRSTIFAVLVIAFVGFMTEKNCS